MSENIIEDRKKILQMVSEGKISVEDAAKLLDALCPTGNSNNHENVKEENKPTPKFFRVSVAPKEGEEGDKVNVRIPLGLIKAGMKFASLANMIPKQAREQVEEALGEQGFDLNNINPSNIDEIIKSLTDFHINVEDQSGKRVQVFCE